ncbi:MAG TPA: dickkopf-related protein [Polyangiales bacterium]
MKQSMFVGCGICAFALAIAGCSAAAPKGSGQASNLGGGAGTGVQAGSTGSSGNGNFGNSNGGSGGTGPTMIMLPDGGMTMTDPTSMAFVQDDTGMAGLDAATVDMLRKATGNCTANIVYPYKDTVLPRGLPSPEIMWTGMADAAYVHMHYANQTNVDYQFAMKGTNPGMIQIPQDAWNKIVGRSKTAPLIVDVNVKSGGAISSCETNWTIAPGTLTGAVYYNTYNAPGAMFKSQGAVMRLTLGKTMSDVYLQDLGAKNGISGTGPCISCHSLSFDGSMLVASRHDYGGNDPLKKVFSFEVSAYPVTTGLQPTGLAGQMDNANFGALYPNGKRILTMGNPQCTNGAETFPRAPNNFIMVPGPSVAQTRDPATGTVVPANGLNKDWYMWMPQFSPDGKHVVFNHGKPDGKGGSDRRELAMMDYDYATNTFSNLKVLVSHLGPEPSLQYAPAGAAAGNITESCTTPPGQDPTGSLPAGACTGPCYPGWPFFTPDGKGVVFQLIDQPDFASAFPGRNQPSKADLWYVDIASRKSVRLDKASNGPKPEDGVANYYPTVMPVALGGYFWLFYTSKRDYGNKVYPDVQLDPSDLSNFTTSFAKQDGKSKRIWVSALRPVGDSTEFQNGVVDISNPPFFLDGQSESGNVRAFTTLNPCTKSGDTSTCTSGLDCCSGYCFIPPNQANAEFDKPPVGHCTDVVPMCSKTNERCNKDADCCPPAAGQPKNTCIGGFCTFITVVQ